MIFWQTIPVLYNQKKNGKNKKRSLLCPGLICVKMDLKILEKNTVADSVPDGSCNTWHRIFKIARNNLY